MEANFKPVIGSYKYTGSFRFWVQKVLPLVYDDSLSYYELLCKVVNYLNDVIQNVDTLNEDVESLVKVFNELQDYINNYFENLDIQEAINIKLDDMANSGEFDILVRDLELLEHMEMYPYLGFDVEGYYPQGYTSYTKNNVTYHACAFISSDENAGMVKIYNETTRYIEATVNGNIGHANGMCYYNGKLYIARAGGSATNRNIINVINTETFEFEENITLNYDTTGIAYYNDYFYCLSSYNDYRVRVYNTDFELVRTITLASPKPSAWNGFTVDDKYMYLVVYHNPAQATSSLSGINVYYKASGKLKGFVRTPFNNYEIEDISLYTNNLLRITAYTGNGHAQLSNCKIFKTLQNMLNSSLKKYENIPIEELTATYYVQNGEVDLNISENGTSTHPYHTIKNAMYGMFLKGATVINLHLNGDFSDEELYIPYIEGVTRFQVFGDGETPSKLGSVYLGGGNYVLFNNIEFTGKNSLSDYSCDIRECTCRFEKCLFSNNTYGGIISRQSKIYIVECEFNTGGRPIENGTASYLFLSNDTNLGNTFDNNYVFEYRNMRIRRMAILGDPSLTWLGAKIRIESSWQYKLFTDINVGYSTTDNINSQLSNITNENLIIICGGLSDFLTDVDLTTFRNSVRNTLNNVKNYNYVYVCTPFKSVDTTNGNNNTLSEFANIIKEECERVGVSCIDLYNESVTHIYNDDNLFSLGRYPNEAGMEYCFASIMNKIV